MIAPLLAVACKRFPSLKKAIADGGYQGKATADDVQDQAGIPLEIVKRSDTAKGFQLLSGPTAGSVVADASLKTTRTSPATTSVLSFLR